MAWRWTVVLSTALACAAPARAQPAADPTCRVRFCEGVALGVRDRHDGLPNGVAPQEPPFHPQRQPPDGGPCAGHWLAGYQAGFAATDADGLTVACPPTDDRREEAFREGFLHGYRQGRDRVPPELPACSTEERDVVRRDGYALGFRAGQIDHDEASNAHLRDGGIAVLVVGVLSALIGVASIAWLASGSSDTCGGGLLCTAFDLSAYIAPPFAATELIVGAAMIAGGELRRARLARERRALDEKPPYLVPGLLPLSGRF
jgi:hypothetical protein